LAKIKAKFASFLLDSKLRVSENFFMSQTLGAGAGPDRFGMDENWDLSVYMETKKKLEGKRIERFLRKTAVALVKKNSAGEGRKIFGEGQIGQSELPDGGTDVEFLKGKFEEMRLEHPDAAKRLFYGNFATFKREIYQLLRAITYDDTTKRFKFSKNQNCFWAPPGSSIRREHSANKTETFDLKTHNKRISESSQLSYTKRNEIFANRIQKSNFWDQSGLRTQNSAIKADLFMLPDDQHQCTFSPIIYKNWPKPAQAQMMRLYNYFSENFDKANENNFNFGSTNFIDNLTRSLNYNLCMKNGVLQKSRHIYNQTGKIKSAYRELCQNFEIDEMRLIMKDFRITEHFDHEKTTELSKIRIKTKTIDPIDISLCNTNIKVRNLFLDVLEFIAILESFEKKLIKESDATAKRLSKLGIQATKPIRPSKHASKFENPHTHQELSPRHLQVNGFFMTQASHDSADPAEMAQVPLEG
jgi:hypothetical protein